MGFAKILGKQPYNIISHGIVGIEYRP